MIEEFKEFEFNGVKYKISNFGRIFGEKCEIKQRLDNDGYPIVTLGGNKRRSCVRVHRLVAIHFIPNPNNLSDVNHKNFDRTDNRADNLEWLSHSDNVKYSIDNNWEIVSKSRQGINNGRASYTVEEVKEIRRLYDEGKTIMEIVKIFYPNMDYKERKSKWNLIRYIAKGISFKNVA